MLGPSLRLKKKNESTLLGSLSFPNYEDVFSRVVSQCIGVFALREGFPTWEEFLTSWIKMI